MDGRVAQGGPRAAAQTASEAVRDWRRWVTPTSIGFALVFLAIVVYWGSGTVRFYNHFVWQALAFLDGRAEIDFPVFPSATSPGNANFQDVLPLYDQNGQLSGKGLLPFPPLPAIVLMPLVAIFGAATDERVVSVLFGGIDVGLAWWMLGRLPVSGRVRLLTTVFFAFGTVLWYAAQLGTTWFLAHVVALAPLLIAIGLALEGDPDARRDQPGAEGDGWLTRTLREIRRPWQLVDRRQLVAGFLFGLACTARLTVAFAAPFFVFVGSGGSWPRRAVSAGLGAAIPIGGLLVYNLATTGHLLHPGYEYHYLLEANGYPSLNYHPDWSIEDIRYLPQNFGIAFLTLPAFFPDAVPASVGVGRALCVDPNAVRGLFNPDCPIALPRDIGMSLILTSPAFLFAIPAVVRDYARSRLVTGSAIAIVLVALINLMHFSQGWVQFGYRFSNDYVPFLLILVALGMSGRAERGRGLALAVILVAASIAINFWGTWWGMKLGW